MEQFELSSLLTEREHAEKRYFEFLRVPALSMGVYFLAAGARDPQQPHAEDEVYYVVGGEAQFTAGDETARVRPGTLMFVEAEVEHQFHDVSEDLTVLVFFAPAESSVATKVESGFPGA